MPELSFSPTTRYSALFQLALLLLLFATCRLTFLKGLRRQSFLGFFFGVGGEYAIPVPQLLWWWKQKTFVSPPFSQSLCLSNKKKSIFKKNVCDLPNSLSQSSAVPSACWEHYDTALGDGLLLFWELHFCFLVFQPVLTVLSKASDFPDRSVSLLLLRKSSSS